MTTTTTTFDTVTRRYRATCPVCGYVAVRAMLCERVVGSLALCAYSDRCAVKP
jgi:hypothetical protein